MLFTRASLTITEQRFFTWADIVDPPPLNGVDGIIHLSELFIMARVTTMTWFLVNNATKWIHIQD